MVPYSVSDSILGVLLEFLCHFLTTTPWKSVSLLSHVGSKERNIKKESKHVRGRTKICTISLNLLNDFMRELSQVR